MDVCDLCGQIFMDGLGTCYDCRTEIEETAKKNDAEKEEDWEEACPICCQLICDEECDAYEEFY